MEQKLQNRYGRWGRALCFALALALAALLSLTALPLTGRVYATGDGETLMPDGEPAPLDAGNELVLDANMKLTVQLPLSSKDWTDLDTSTIQVDVYKVADAVKIPGYNVYGYKLDTKDTFGAAIASFIEKDPNKVDWLRQDVVPEGGTEAVSTFRYAPTDTSKGTGWTDLRKVMVETLAKNIGSLKPVVSNGKIGAEILLPSAGLYLYVAHADAETLKQGSQYIVTTNDGFGSIAVSGTYLYIFSPQLISLPGLAGNETQTTSAANWTDTVTAVAKGDRTPRYVDLSVTKMLNQIKAGSDGVPVVVEITGWVIDPESQKPEEKKIQIGLRPTAAGAAAKEEREVFDYFLAGHPITVTETYCTPDYEPETKTFTWKDAPAGHLRLEGIGADGKPAPFTIEIGTPISADFVNDLKPDVPTSGGGFVNQFEDNSGWKCSNDGGDTWADVKPQN